MKKISTLSKAYQAVFLKTDFYVSREKFCANFCLKKHKKQEFF